MRYFIQGMFTQGEDKRKGVGVEICILVLGTTMHLCACKITAGGCKTFEKIA